MSSDVGTSRPTPIFDEVDRWAHGGRSMLSFGSPSTDAPSPATGPARTVLALLAAAREERTPRHALRRP